MNTCEEHGKGILVYEGWSCPACDQLEELQNKHDQIVNDYEQQVNEADDRIVELESELEAKAEA